MRIILRGSAALLAITLSLACARATAGGPTKSFYVNAAADMKDVAPGDGVCNALPVQGATVCTLRAAVMEGNTVGQGMDVNIVLLPGVTFKLAIPGRDEAASATGDLNIKRPMRLGIASGMAQRARIDANGLDRAISIAPTAPGTILYGLEIVNGSNAYGAAINSLANVTKIEWVDLHDNKNVVGATVIGSIVRQAGGAMNIHNSRVHHNGRNDEPVNALSLISGILDVQRSSVDSNHGVGIDSQKHNALLNVSNSTIAKNSGRGIFVGSLAEIQSSTIADNGGFQISFYGTSAMLQLRNSVLRGGTSPACEEREGGTAFLAYYNIYSDHSCTSDGVDDRSGHGVADLGLGGFALSSGPTPTFEPLPGSIVIDFAPGTLCGGWDQRRRPRPVAYEFGDQPRCDTGAVELATLPPDEPPPDEPPPVDPALPIFTDSFEGCDDC